jgi:hypothetical protein
MGEIKEEAKRLGRLQQLEIMQKGIVVEITKYDEIKGPMCVSFSLLFHLPSSSFYDYPVYIMHPPRLACSLSHEYSSP